MKYLRISRLRAKNIILSLLLAFCIYSAPSAQAFSLGSLSSSLTSVSQGVASIGSAIQIGTSIVNDFLGIFGGGSSSNSAVSAGVPNVPNGGILPGPGNSAYGISYTRDVFLPNVTNWIVSLVLAGSVIVVIIAGLMYIVGGGDQEMQNKARETITWAVIGMGITVLAYALVRIVITINYLG